MTDTQAKRKLEQYLVILMNERGGEGLSARMRMLVADIRAQWQELDRRIGEFDAEFVRWAKENEDARRLVTIPGVGVTTSTVSDCSRWQGRDFRTWSRSCGMAGLGSASVDDRRQATTPGDQQARK
jgi:transposase